MPTWRSSHKHPEIIQEEHDIITTREPVSVVIKIHMHRQQFTWNRSLNLDSNRYELISLLLLLFKCLEFAEKIIFWFSFELFRMLVITFLSY